VSAGATTARFANEASLRVRLFGGIPPVFDESVQAAESGRLADLQKSGVRNSCEDIKIQTCEKREFDGKYARGEFTGDYLMNLTTCQLVTEFEPGAKTGMGKSERITQTRGARGRNAERSDIRGRVRNRPGIGG
jgi:hypothetical protein